MMKKVNVTGCADSVFSINHLQKVEQAKSQTCSHFKNQRRAPLFFHVLSHIRLSKNFISILLLPSVFKHLAQVAINVIYCVVLKEKQYLLAHMILG